MSDFMLWLYANYIRPQMRTPAQGSDYALRLGLRTGEGLALSRR